MFIETNLSGYIIYYTFIILYKLQCVIGILATEKCRIRTRVLISYQTHVS